MGGNNPYFDAIIEGREYKLQQPKKKAPEKKFVMLKEEPKKNGFWKKTGKFVVSELKEAGATKYGQWKKYRKEKSKAVYQEKVRQLKKDIRRKAEAKAIYDVDSEKRKSKWIERPKNELWLK